MLQVQRLNGMNRQWFSIYYMLNLSIYITNMEDSLMKKSDVPLQTQGLVS